MTKQTPDKTTTKADNRRFLQVIRLKGDDLAFRDVLIYSALVFRSRKCEGATQSWISRITTISARHSVPDGLLELERHMLAQQIENKWYAVKPAGENEAWFGYKGKQAETWESQFAYTTMELRAVKSKLTLHQHFLYSTLLSLAKARKTTSIRQSVAGLAKLTGFSRPTIRSGLAKLTEHKLVESTRQGLLKINEPSQDQLKWWQGSEPQGPVSDPHQSVTVAVAKPVETAQALAQEDQERIDAYLEYKTAQMSVEEDKPAAPPVTFRKNSALSDQQIVSAVVSRIGKSGMPDKMIQWNIDEVAAGRIWLTDWVDCYERAKDIHSQRPGNYSNYGGLLQKFVNPPAVPQGGGAGRRGAGGRSRRTDCQGYP